MKTLIYAWRFLTRARSYTVINLLGLAFSLACCMVLTRYLYRELTVDTNSIDPETIVVPLRDRGGNIFPGENPSPTKKADCGVPDDYIVERCLLVILEKENIVCEKVNYRTRLLAADSTFFHFFRYPLVAGETMLNAPNDAILTRDYACRLFGDRNPIGEILNYSGKTLTVRGVIDRPSCKTSWDFDLLVPHHHRDKWMRLNAELLRVLPSLDLNEVNTRSNIYREDKYKEQLRYRFITWKDFYFEPTIAGQYESILHFGNRHYLSILWGVTVLLFLVGVLNFVNLYLVFMMKRTRGYGIKKVFGLSRGRLFVEIWLENFLLVAVSLFVAWVLIEVTQGLCVQLLGDTIGYTAFDLWLSVGILVMLPLLTSTYPWLKYGYERPVTSMRSLSTSRLSVATRITFLGIQYVITLSLIIVSIYFKKHFDLLIETPPGFRTEGNLRVDLAHENTTFGLDAGYWSRQKLIGQKLDACPHIECWTISGSTILGRNQSISQILNDRDQSVTMPTLFVPATFFQLYGLKVLEGKIPEGIVRFNKSQIVLNRAAMRALGYKTREEAFVRSQTPLWVSVSQDGKQEEGGTSLMSVAAVVEDYYPGHLSEGICPMAFLVSPTGTMGHTLIQAKPGHEKELMDYLCQLEKEIYHTEDFTYEWMDNEIARLYKKDRHIARIYSTFAVAAILVSCLGLFGLSLFDIHRRYKEIAVRKINGAQVRDICLLLSYKYLLVLAAAFVVAVPLAIVFIQNYTEGFAVKAAMDAGMILLALLVVAAVSLGTLFWQVNRAARINPAEVVKRE